MEKQFTCSKEALKKARVTFWFYIACIPMIAVLVFLPYTLNRTGRIEWFAIIYFLIAAFFAYRGYRAYRVLRAIRQTCCTVWDGIVSGVSTPEPYQKGIRFQIPKNEISEVLERYVPVERKGSIPLGKSLQQPPISPETSYGFRSTVIRTHNDVYTLFAIELTDEMKEMLKTEE